MNSYTFWHESFECTISYFSVLPPILDEITKEEFSRVLDVNVLGAFLVSKVSESLTSDMLYSELF